MGIGYRSTNLDGCDEIYLIQKYQNRQRKKRMKPTSDGEKKILKNP